MVYNNFHIITPASVISTFDMAKTSYAFFNKKAEQSSHKTLVGHESPEIFGRKGKDIIWSGLAGQSEWKPSSALIPSQRISFIRAAILVSFRRTKFESV